MFQYVVIHEHRFGTDVYLIKCEKNIKKFTKRIKDKVAILLDIDYEEGRIDENLYIGVLEGGDIKELKL